ncbi:hypothetical protein M408DRAFT_65060 [Serendipita vermifera MAFF 305830]|uniref:SH3 domain-containing protein n=1 Tax=Serendipita vermifera MAFF 305830 TaxID=933852 RepID=A0A0C2XRB7_SERVB|nr:hypothetical protein M408DRAFT_65060 [Serendipita vermifera MAFF 305830]
MSRRQSSQSSLSRYARGSEAGELENRSMDFCNAFWGLNDPGYEVLLARMGIAAQTVDDLKNFWKERAAIEEEYARKLVRLSKQSLGQGEIAELRNSLDVVRQETERQAGQHLTLSITIRKELENSAAEFAAKQAHHRKTFQAPIEKTYKQKQQNEHYVAKAKERYEQDCHRVNSYTAQRALAQGKELEKIQLRLERAQSTVEGNKRDYQNFTRALADTVARWDKEWKTFCDQCQDLEEERLEFMKDNIWAYANAVSTVCVNEDESCEAVRVALERLEVEKDIEYFIINHGTGSAIPEPAPFISYTAADPTPLKPMTRVANFARSTNRPQSFMAKLATPHTPADEEPAGSGNAGVGAHSRGNSYGHLTGQDTGPPPPAQLPPLGGPSPGPSIPPIGNSAPNPYHHPSTSIGSTSGPNSYSQAGPTPYSQVPPTNPPSSIPQARRTSYQSTPNNNEMNAALTIVTSVADQRTYNVPSVLERALLVSDTDNDPCPLVKALYDYTATIEEEFDFQAGDVIAVLATPDDGWWQGILLDDSRRQPGRTVFPSNFVCLF